MHGRNSINVDEADKWEIRITPLPHNDNNEEMRIPIKVQINQVKDLQDSLKQLDSAKLIVNKLKALTPALKVKWLTDLDTRRDELVAKAFKENTTATVPVPSTAEDYDGAVAIVGPTSRRGSGRRMGASARRRKQDNPRRNLAYPYSPAEKTPYLDEEDSSGEDD